MLGSAQFEEDTKMSNTSGLYHHGACRMCVTGNKEDVYNIMYLGH